MKKQKLFLSMLLLSMAVGLVDAGDKLPLAPPPPGAVPPPVVSNAPKLAAHQNKPGQKKSAAPNAQPPKAMESKRKQFCARTGPYKDQNKYKAFQDAFCGRTSPGGKAGRFDDHAVQKAIDADGLDIGGKKTPVPTLVRALIFEKKPKQGKNKQGTPQHHDQGKGDHNQHPGNQHQNEPHHPAPHHDQGQGAHSHKGALTISNTGVHDDVQKKLNIEMGFKVLENGVLKMIHPVHQFSIPAKGHQRHENYIPQNVLAELHKNKNNKLIISASTMVNAKCVEAQNLQIHPDDQVEFAVHGGKTVDDPIALVFSVTACGSCDNVTPPPPLAPGHHEEKKKP